MTQTLFPFRVSELLETLLAGEDLSNAQATEAMTAMVEGRVEPAGMAALLTALRAKGEKEQEIAAFASVLRTRTIHIPAPDNTLDTCGTGGDKSDTFNISTAAALVAAAMGIPVAKHGNRSISSRSGSADVLRVLGVNVEASPDTVVSCVRDVGIGFLFAPALHPGMKHAAPVRKELGIRTVFNLLGPLANPARAKRQLLGVFAPRYCSTFARVLQLMGSEKALVVCGTGPGGTGHLDEVSPWGPTQVARLEHGKLVEETFDPTQVGVHPPEADALAAKDPEDSARIIGDVLEGKAGPAFDTVVLNASAAAQAAGKAESWQQGVDLAKEVLVSGKAKSTLEKLIQASNR